MTWDYLYYHVTHTAQPFRQLGDLMPTLPTPYPI